MPTPTSTSVLPLDRISLVDLDAPELDWGRVSCAVFACGTERRSSFLVQQCPSECLDRILVLDFDGPLDEIQEENRTIYLARTSRDSFFVPKSDVRSLIERIQDCVNRSPRHTDTVFIDISSMPRLWYLSIVMWLRFSPLSRTYRLVVAYSGARYQMPYPDRQIVELRSVLGTGGFYDASQPVLAIIGLGFDSGAALTVEEKIEPDRTIAVVSRTNSNKAYRAHSEEVNKDILERADEVVYLSSSSFAQPFQGLSELISPLDGMNVICAPLGPKPHVLAFALAGLIYPRVSSIHVVSKYSSPFHADPNGEVCFGEITFVHPDGV